MLVCKQVDETPVKLITYEVANNHLAFSIATSSLSGGLFGGGVARLSRCLLNTTDRSGCNRPASRTALASATTTNGAALG